MPREQWLDGSEPLVNLGFSGTSGMVVYIPLDFPVNTARLMEDYHSKVVVQYIAPRRMLAVDIPIVKRNGKPWGKWRITKKITAHSGLVSFQYRAVNEYYRLLVGRPYRAIIFDSIGETTESVRGTGTKGQAC